MATPPRDILWYNSATGDIQIWFMVGNKIDKRANVVDEKGHAIVIGPPWSIAGAGDTNGNGKADIVWHNNAAGEIQIWFMDGQRIVGRANVVDESGKVIPIGAPWDIIDVGDMNGNQRADIVWHNHAGGETQIWFMQGNQITSRANVVDERGQTIFIGSPWSIAGVGDVNGNGKADIVWHNNAAGETQIWFMDGNRITGRANIVDEQGKVIPIGPPWGIVGVGDIDGSGNSDIVWYNSSTGDIQIWFMKGERIVRRANVVDENGHPILIAPPWAIVGIGKFNNRVMFDNG